MTATKIMSGLVLAGIAVLAVSAPASAASTSSRNAAIEKREQAQEDAIRAGRRDGSLTWLETYRLNREQRRIDSLEARARADGKVTAGEYSTIKRAQDDAARHIYSEKHDEQVRGWFWRGFVR